jgi:hypothetical protein
MEAKSLDPRSLQYQTPGLHTPWYHRVNWRIVIFVIAIGIVVGYPLYIYLDAALSGGIKDAGGGYKEVDLKAMSTFHFPQQDGTINDIPTKWRELDGKKVVLYGEIAPTMTSAGPFIETFQLCYSVAKCCYSGPPQVQHFVDSRPIPGAQLSYASGLVKVKGILHVKVKKGEEKVDSVYQMDVESLEPVQ